MNDERCKQHDYPLRRCDGCVKYAKECLRSTMSEECTKKIEQARASALKENNEMWEKRVEAHGASQYQAGFEAGDRTGRADERKELIETLLAYNAKLRSAYDSYSEPYRTAGMKTIDLIENQIKKAGEKQ